MNLIFRLCGILIQTKIVLNNVGKFEIIILLRHYCLSVIIIVVAKIFFKNLYLSFS
jgi:hypothetical protein